MTSCRASKTRISTKFKRGISTPRMKLFCNRWGKSGGKSLFLSFSLQINHSQHGHDHFVFNFQGRLCARPGVVINAKPDSVLMKIHWHVQASHRLEEIARQSCKREEKNREYFITWLTSPWLAAPSYYSVALAYLCILRKLSPVAASNRTSLL